MSALPVSVVFKPAQTGLFNIKDPSLYKILKVCRDSNVTLKEFMLGQG
jgi:hypothetical protein